MQLEITPPVATIVVGNPQPFFAFAGLSDLSTRDVSAEVTWLSDNETIATIDATGRATGVSTGGAVITASHRDGSNATATLTVRGVLVAQIIVSPPNATLAVGATASFDARAVFDDGSDRLVTDEAIWLSSHEPTATVVAGAASGVAPGSASVTATFDGTISNTARVVVN